MRNKLLTILILSMFLISFAYATEITLGIFKQGQDISLIQLCGDCTYINQSSTGFDTYVSQAYCCKI